MKNKRLVLDLARRVHQFYETMNRAERNITYGGHWWDHIVRVTNNAVFIMRHCTPAKNNDWVIAAALCHDLAYRTSPADVSQSAEACQRLMIESGYSPRIAKEASLLILATDRDSKEPSSRDERILYVSDKLDLLGVEGTIRLAIEHSNDLTIREDLGNFIRGRQDDWVRYMLTLDVANDLVRRKQGESEQILRKLPTPELDL